MGIEDQLAAALGSRAAGAHPAPDALERVRSHARRRRQAARVRTTSGLAAVAAVAVAAPFLLRLAAGPVPLPPAGSPTPTSSPSPSASPSPPQSASPAPAGASREEFAAVTEGNALVLVSARTGAVTRTVATLDARPFSVDLAPDGRTAYVDIPRPGVPFEEWTTAADCPRVVAVDVATGAQRQVTVGTAPQVSADGRLAVADCPGDGVRIVPPSGPEASYPDDGPDAGAGEIAWAPDGRSLYVQERGDDSNWLVRLDPAADRSLADATDVVVTFFLSMNVPVPWRDTLLHTSNLDDHLPYSRQVTTARSYQNGYTEDYEVLFELPATGPEPITQVVVGSDDQVLVRAGDELWRWDGAGAPVRLGPAYPIVGW